jgi:hypothetical protein
MSTPLLMFLLLIAITLGITGWAARRSTGANAYFVRANTGLGAERAS